MNDLSINNGQKTVTVFLSDKNLFRLNSKWKSISDIERRNYLEADSVETIDKKKTLHSCYLSQPTPNQNSQS